MSWQLLEYSYSKYVGPPKLNLFLSKKKLKKKTKIHSLISCDNEVR